MTQAAHNTRPRHDRHSQLSALAMDLSYYLDRLYTTGTTNYATSRITISHLAIYCDAAAQTDPLTSPSFITHSTKTSLRPLSLCLWGIRWPKNQPCISLCFPISPTSFSSQSRLIIF
ncbi:uncharacterized [Tachysurus ichikawai]